MANKHAFLEKLRAIVLEHYSEEQFGVSDLVEHFGMSRSQMHRKLKSATGQSVSQFIREIRLDEALKLLQKEDTTASEVAYKVGFNSPTYFNTCFNEYFGYPPGESQLQMELAKSNTNSEEPSPAKVPKVRKNGRVVLWFLIISAAVLALFVYKYVDREEATLVSTSEVKEKTIAVLPLKNWSGDMELEYISDGMTDAIISKLSEIKDIDRVIPFSSMIRYKDTQKDLQEIAKELNVAYILEGNFKLSGTKVQSNLKLIEASTLEHVWKLEYTGAWKSDEIFEMQAAVAENVATTMTANIAKDEMNVLQHRTTKSEEAYRIYLEAEYQHNKYSEYGLKNAIDLYNQAIIIDSSFVDSYVGLASSYMLSGLVWGILPQEEAWQKARPILERALILDSLQIGRNRLQIEGQLYSGLFYFELDIQAAERNFLKAFRSYEDLCHMNFAFDFSRKTGRYLFTMKLWENDDFTRNSATGDAHMQKAILHYMLGDKQKAIDLFKTSDPLQQDNYYYLQETSKWYFYMGEIEKSRQHLERMLEQFKGRPPINNWLIAVHSKIAHEDEKLESSLNILQQQFTDNDSGSPAWFLALYYFYLGDNDTGFGWLQKSYDRREVEMTWLKEEPLLKSLKEDPRYIDLYEKMGFQYVNQELIE